MSTESWYLCGPMSGIPKFNFPAFQSAAKRLRKLGYTIISPAELDDEYDKQLAVKSPDGKITDCTKTWGDFLSRDVKYVADKVKGIVFLPDWYKSRGAVLEATVGLLCDHKFALYDPTSGLVEVTKEHVKLRVYGRL